ncbi:Ubiquitin-like-specific protease 1C [Turnera subulata]|uniref:Ubiquitin-like-specific protease 1C n=1 Tax=Turnera subulata TaxID=218843 RepID=A0A9Q0FFV2_9ROSI|nr:Ubiquitin-like-specific protease 1C [Turnera subulata]
MSGFGKELGWVKLVGFPPSCLGEASLQVPQQKNDYDCGLFVLYFMERFIEEAPQRLKKRDLEMFGKQWFKPEEASNLRTRIQSLLMDEFENADNDLNVSDSPPSSGGGTTP